MSRLPRPPIKIEVRLVVVLRQLGHDDDHVRTAVFSAKRYRRLKKELEANLFVLACHLGCPTGELRLDHTLALENREKVFRRGVHVDYRPRSADPGWLAYRPHGAQYAGSHHVKTNVRGDNGQLSDNMLAKRNRRIAKKRATSNFGLAHKAAASSGRKHLTSRLTSCRLGRSCSCARRARKRCGNWRKIKIRNRPK